jgi:acetyltransferase
LAPTPEEASAYAQECGYPVVLKIIAPAWVHKSDQGGVLLNLTTPQEVQAGFRHLQNIFNQVGSSAPLEGILVQKQIKGREILLGLKQDATFGPVVVCGLGGIFTEVLQDVAQTLAPISLAQAHDLLSTLKGFPLLQGYRGEPPIALPELAAALVNLSWLAIQEPELQELDINPLIATPAGCWAVDARIVLGK